MAGIQAQKNAITLKGSTAIVSEFFDYGINSILYQRGVYPEYMFSRKMKYGLPLMMTSDDKVKDYLSNIITQVEEWLLKLTVQKLVVLIKATENDEIMERWQFDVTCNKSCDENSVIEAPDDKSIQKGIQGVIRQITSSVTFLPLLDVPCTFDILVYTDDSTDTPQLWKECGPGLIDGEEQVKLRSFNTNIHKIEGMVCYKL